jgi:transposase
MGYFWRLFDIEDELRELSDDERHTQRQLRSRPLLNEFKSWMDKQLETLRPKHDLRGAINYMTTRWECFERFLEAGNIPFDNNASEQAVKNPVIGKKNWLFFGSPVGGHAAAILYSLTTTCRQLKIDPYAYLKDVFERLPLLLQNPSNSAVPKLLMPLLPDHWLADHPEFQLQIRAGEASLKSARRRSRRTRRRQVLQNTGSHR